MRGVYAATHDILMDSPRGVCVSSMMPRLADLHLEMGFLGTKLWRNGLAKVERSGVVFDVGD